MNYTYERKINDNISNIDIDITITKLTDLNLLRKACESTMEGTSKISLNAIYRCMHSPMRTQLFYIEMKNIPSFVSVHFVRHKIGVEHFVLSKRDDRFGDNNTENRLTPINHSMLINAESIVNMSRKRLCSKAHEETRIIMEFIKYEMFNIDEDLYTYMVPECVFRNHACPELKSCNASKVWKLERGYMSIVDMENSIRGN